MSRRFVVLAAFALASCSPKTFILKKGAESAAPYFVDGEKEKTSFEKLTAHVYTFRWTWYRNVAIDTDEGWVVVDPFNPEAAKAEMAYLKKTEPNKKVRLLIYSHYHLDHTRGGGAGRDPAPGARGLHRAQLRQDSQELSQARSATICAARERLWSGLTNSMWVKRRSTSNPSPFAFAISTRDGSNTAPQASP